MGNEPWIIAGDFNMISHPLKSSNTHQEFTADIREFISCLTQIAVFDHSYAETLLTWSNRQTEGFLGRKLDRVLINGNWLPCFGNSTVEFLPPEIFDHCHALMKLN